MMLDAGTYRARAIDGALGMTANEKEQVAIRFQLLDLPESITWYGFFSEKTEDHTMRALASCGWDWVSMETKPDAPEVSIVIEREEGHDGVMRAKVRWVNEARGLGLKRRMTHEETALLAARLARHESFPVQAFQPVPTAAARADTQGTVDDFDPNSQEDSVPF